MEYYEQQKEERMNMSNGKLAASEILKFRDYAWNAYHENPKYLNLLETKFGKPARADMEDTLRIKLKRKLLGD